MFYMYEFNLLRVSSDRPSSHMYRTEPLKARTAMQAHETQYDLCQEHLVTLTHSSALLAAALRVYKDSDHNIEALDSPFFLDMNEELIGLNVQVENLIRRISPTYGIDESERR
jgi:hypothetical protein